MSPYPQPATATKPLTADPQKPFYTERKDFWQFENIFTIVTLVAFGVYGIMRALENNYFEAGLTGYRAHLLSPFYSPQLQKMIPALGSWLSSVGWSPAFLVLWIPLGFRGTCYFYRRAYYRAFFQDPPSCGVSELEHVTNRGQDYEGERAFPFVWQNMHRYFFYLAALLAIYHWWHVYESTQFVAMDGTHHFGLTVGSVVIFLDALLLSLYVFSCHSWRHLLAGSKNCFSCTNFTKATHEAWKGQTKLNEKHMELAWTSLFMVGIADIYVRLVASGVIQDLPIIHP